MTARVLGVLGVLAGSLVLGLGLLSTAPAVAHSDLIRSAPEDGQQLAAAPERVELVFAQPVVAELSEVELRGPDGDRPAEGLLADDSSLVALFEGGAASGLWTVDYQTVAADGHVVSGSVEFLVGTSEAESPGTGRSGLILLGAVAALVSAVWVARAFRLRAEVMQP